MPATNDRHEPENCLCCRLTQRLIRDSYIDEDLDLVIQTLTAFRNFPSVSRITYPLEAKRLADRVAVAVMHLLGL